jgi:23S rRNA pseudouridine2605 synthase
VSTLRLARFLARAGVTSRRGAAELVASGRVAINGAPPRGPGDPVDPAADRVTLDGRPLAVAELLWLALHKPPGYVTSRCGTSRHQSIFVLLPSAPAALVAVGRLDVYSEGLLLCTTDGDAAHRLMHPRWQVPRTYLVEVAGTMGPAQREALARGVPIGEERPVRPTRWRYTAGRGSGGELELELREGRSRVVRRMAAALGLGVRRLVRVAYGPVTLGALAPGGSRRPDERELDALYAAIELPRPPLLSR